MTTRRMLIALFAVSAVAGATAPVRAAVVATSIAPANLQGYWQFDESNSASPPLTNPTPDQSGNARNGTYESAAQRVTDGSFSSVLGAGNKTLYTPGGSNQEVTVGAPTPLSAFGIGGSFTVSFWVNVQGTASQPAPVLVAFRTGGVGGWRIGYNHVTGGSNLRYYIGQNNGAAEAYIFDDGLATPGTWQFITYTYDSTSTTGKFYINGTLTPLTQAAGTFGTPVTPGGGVPLSIGGTYGGSDLFKGFLDDVAIWNTPLSGSQVSSLYLSYAPEPASAALLSIGGLLVLRRRKV